MLIKIVIVTNKGSQSGSRQRRWDGRIVSYQYNYSKPSTSAS